MEGIRPVVRGLGEGAGFCGEEWSCGVETCKIIGHRVDKH